MFKCILSHKQLKWSNLLFYIILHISIQTALLCPFDTHRVLAFHLLLFYSSTFCNYCLIKWRPRPPLEWPHCEWSSKGATNSTGEAWICFSSCCVSVIDKHAVHSKVTCVLQSDLGSDRWRTFESQLCPRGMFAFEPLIKHQTKDLVRINIAPSRAARQSPRGHSRWPKQHGSITSCNRWRTFAAFLRLISSESLNLLNCWF